MMFYILLPLFVVFTLWLGYRITQKAGHDGWWTLVLLLPIVNVIMIWMFAFSRWPNFPADAERDSQP
ncbi:MAG: hypothetical protein ACU837_08025 [Gammaproteobacteria bacterium]